MSNRIKIIFLLIIVYALIFMLTKPSHAQTSKTATLNWDANTEADLKGYRVYRDTLSCNQLGPKQFVAEINLVTTYVDASIPNDASLASWNISAVNTSNQESTRSNCVEKTFLAPPSAGGMVVISIGSTTVDATMAAVSDGAGGTAGYELRYAVAPSLSTTGWSAGTTTAACKVAGPCQLTGLSPSTQYEIQFRTVRVSDGATGPLSAIITLTTAAKAPQAPKGLRVVSNPAPDSVALMWDQEGGDPQQNRVDRLNQTTGSWFPVTTVLGASKTAVVPLANVGKRLYRVCAVHNAKDLCEKSGVWASR